MLNSIGLDNDGLEGFLGHHLPYLASIGCPLIVSIAGSSVDDFVSLAGQLDARAGVDALELNISCPNVSGGVDFGTNPELCYEVVQGVRKATDLPILAKLTPNVANIASIAQAAEAAGADALTLINTLLGMAVDWRGQKPMLGNILGGLSGPAIKPVALRCVYQAAQAVQIPIIGVGGIATLDDVMEFLVTGASAIQLGTVNFYNPTVSMKILDDLPAAVRQLGKHRVQDVVGTLTPAARSPSNSAAKSEVRR
jgi:dihydroorotate dehydrogenase (NAD+) catalytic subunit